MKTIVSIICLFFIASCGAKYRSVSDLNLQPTALKEDEPVKLIFAMTGSTDNREDKYYNQIIVVSQETGDTCNILVPVNHALQQGDGDKVFYYSSPNNKTAMIILQPDLQPEKIRDGININDLTVMFPKYDKVIYDSKYKSWLSNNFPTVFGVISTRN